MTIIDDMLTKARAYAQAGWQLVPLHSVSDGVCTCRLKDKCKAAGKHPRITKWQDKATSDPKQIEAWLSQWPDSNLGLRLGPGSDVVDIEFDDAAGEATANELLSDIETPTYQSHRSTHRLFKFPADIEINKAVEKVKGLEIRFGTDKRGAQSVLPPSRHHSGKQYEWVISIEDCELAEFPDCIKELLRGDTKVAAIGELDFTMQSDDGLKSHPGEREGQRNEMLCRLIGKWIAMHGVNAELLDEAISWGSRCSPPMDPQEVAQTVSNIAGKELAKGIPATASSLPTRQPGKLSLTPFNEIDPQEVEWLWQDRIALGKLTLVCGEPGLGKTFACCDIAARVSSGQAFPDGAMPPKGKVLILTCEDGPGDTLRPRLDKHDADVSQVFNIEGVERANGEVAFISLKDHLPTLEAYFESEPTIKLLVVDPISAFLGDRCDSHNNTSVRAVLGPLCELAERHKVAVVGITHLSKSEAKAINRVIGSIAFVAAARAAWIVAQDDDDDKRLFLQIKNNLANASGLSYSIVDGRCEWGSDPILIAADDIGGEQETPRAEAEKWLRETLADKPMPAKWMMNTARKDGISDRTLKRAKKALGVLSDKIGDAWTWRLPDEPKPELEDGVFIVK